MEKITAEIKKVNKVLDDHMEIPNYQRPYRWTEDNVRLLLEDITHSWKKGKSSYRIGSVILNNKDAKLNIVDGKNEINEGLLDNLGNLCLVSKSSNSKMNNEHPTGKAAIDGKYYKTNLPPKQKVIYDLTNYKKQWGNEEILNHRIEIADLLDKRKEILIISN